MLNKTESYQIKSNAICYLKLQLYIKYTTVINAEINFFFLELNILFNFHIIPFNVCSLLLLYHY